MIPRQGDLALPVREKASYGATSKDPRIVNLTDADMEAKYFFARVTIAKPQAAIIFIKHRLKPADKSIGNPRRPVDFRRPAFLEREQHIVLKANDIFSLGDSHRG